MSNEWIEIKPQVNEHAEFFEIANDFGDPLEILREAIANSIDAGATWVRIAFTVEEIEGAATLVLQIDDNGSGMSFEILSNDFWGLGFSRAREDKDKIGEKGHGTKIYLRSERVVVRTQAVDEAAESLCDRPMRSLTKRECHSPRIRKIDKYQDTTGTSIRIEGYNQNERSQFVQDVVKDYLLWFTKVGSIESVFGIDRFSGFKVYLKCLDVDDFEEISFGHVFPPENSNIERLFDAHGPDAAALFVKTHKWEGRLERLPEVTFEAVVCVEGDQAKRTYNPMIRERIRGGTGRYRVADRYGIWLCKDFIPIQRVNEWITGFGTGSNSFVLLHGFVNCQTLKLTANRGSIANTDTKVVDELRRTTQQLLERVDKDLHRNGLFTLLDWQKETRTLSQEKAEFDQRTKSVTQKAVARLDGHVLLEPQNESELFGVFVAVHALHPEIFEFEALDYNTTRGIDIIARNKTQDRVSECRFWYVELKYLLREKFDGHAFRNIRWIVCWDFHKSANTDSEFRSIEETDVRRLKVSRDIPGHTTYFLDSGTAATKIQVIKLKEFLKESLGLEFAPEV